MDNDISEEKIQQQMKETRASLTEKLETLEQKVVGTVENATSAVTETVESIKEKVQDTVTTVQEGVKGGVDSVKDFLDLPTQVQRRPWLMVGGSVAVGYCLGTVLMQKSEHSRESHGQPSWLSSQVASHSAHRAAPAPAPSHPASSTSESSVWSAEVDKLKALALGTLFGTARELLISSLPEHMGAQLREVVDSVTKKVGGKPLPSSDWDKLREPAEEEEASSEEPVGSQQPRKKDTGNGHSARRW
jgi:ElaB/YqjD/DUF883 family membrane-anchored ribosome-binding protein